MYRALGIPEIVRMVLALCNHQSTLARSARVCRMWKEPALDILWREVYDLRKLLAILSPLTRVTICDHGDSDSDSDNDELYDAFSAIPSGQDWDHFMSYSRRVKKMAFNGSAPLSGELMLYVSLANKRPLLPNLEALVWRDPNTSSILFFSVAFMSPSLRYLQIVITNPSVPPRCIPSFLDLVRVCAPSLLKLELLISWRYAPEHYRDALVKLLQSLPNLQAFKLSPMAFTPEVVETLIKLPHLEKLGYQLDYRQHKISHLKLPPPALGMRVGSFSQLAVLAAPLSSIADFILGRGRLESIYSLEIQALSHTDNLKEIFHALPLVFPNLAILKLRFCQRENAINMDILRPLFDIPQIKEFYLSDDVACHLSDSDVEEMSSKWPMLEVLHLNEDHPSTNISLSALIPLAKNCRRLYRLGLGIKDEVPVLHGTPTSFARLETFCVGRSSATKPAKIAAFLSQLCHGPLHIQGPTDMLWNLTTNFADERRLRDRSFQWEQWQIVDAVHEELRLARVKVLEEFGAGLHYCS